MSPAILLVLFALAAAPATPRNTQVPERAHKETDGSKLVQVSLVADRARIRPGEHFTLGVQLRIRPSWHVYWENAGDAGKPTEVELHAPAGFEVGALRFPCPLRRVDAGDIVSYVHEGDVLLLADVQAPATLAPGAAQRFAVDCDWLVCTDYCLTGQARAELELDVAPASAAAAPANESLFAAGRLQLPRPWKDVLGDVRPALVRAPDDASFVVTIEVPGARALEFFPDTSTSSTFRSRAVTTTPEGARIELKYDHDAASKAFDYRGVLWIQDAKGTVSCLQEQWLPARS